MARTVASDFIHSMRYIADVVGRDGTRFLERPGVTGLPQSGFSAVTTPEATVEAVEYKEGTDIYTRKYPGNPSMNDLSFSRGVARRDSSFWDWLRRVIEGSGEYRADVDIKHFHRDTALVRNFPTTGDQPNLTRIDTSAPGRTYHCYEVFPTRHKVAADMDATSSEVSVMELDAAFEFFEVEEGQAP